MTFVMTRHDVTVKVPLRLLFYSPPISAILVVLAVLVFVDIAALGMIWRCSLTYFFHFIAAKTHLVLTSVIALVSPLLQLFTSVNHQVLALRDALRTRLSRAAW